MSQNLQSKNLLATIDQAKKQSFSTAMQTLQTQESAFNTALENVQNDLKADFKKMSQELIQSCRQSNQETLTSLTEAMNSSLKSNANMMTTLQSQSEKVLEQTEHSQASLLMLQSKEDELIRTLEKKYKQSMAEALTALSESHKAHLKEHKTLTKLPMLVMVCLTVLVLLNMIGLLILVDYLQKWKNFSLALGLIAFLVIVICGTWAWIENNKKESN